MDINKFEVPNINEDGEKLYNLNKIKKEFTTIRLNDSTSYLLIDNCTFNLVEFMLIEKIMEYKDVAGCRIVFKCEAYKHEKCVKHLQFSQNEEGYLFYPSIKGIETAFNSIQKYLDNLG